MERDVGIYRRPNAVATEVGASQKHKDFAKTVEFIEHALVEGAHEKAPERYLDATFTYLLSPTYITLRRTGETFNITGERVRQIRNRTVPYLWENSSPSTQSQFPLEELELNLNKPLRIKEKKAKPISKTKQFFEDLKTAKTDEEKQRLLNLVTRFMYHKFIKGDNPILVTIRNLATEAGYHTSHQTCHLLSNTVIAAGVPTGKIPAQRTTQKIYSYHFVFSEDKDRAKEALYNNKDLNQFLRHPVVQILGPKEKQLPSTAFLRRFGRFNNLLYNKLEINPTKQGREVIKQVIKLLIAQNDCPVQIYDHYGRLFYRPSQATDLQNYIAKKMQEMVLAAA